MLNTASTSFDDQTIHNKIFYIEYNVTHDDDHDKETL